MKGRGREGDGLKASERVTVKERDGERGIHIERKKTTGRQTGTYKSAKSYLPLSLFPVYSYYIHQV